MLEVRDLSVSYGQHRALESACLHVGRGEIVVILGANGAGKSTLLKAIAGICEGQVAGSALMQGEEILGMAPHRIVEAGIALVPEGRGVFGDLTVAENLVLGAHPNRARDEERPNMDRVMALFPKLAERRRQVVRTMSGGEQQMVAIGRAMMSNPSLLALDEPSLGLSPLLSKEVFQTLTQVRQSGIGILLVEQNARASLAIADRGYLLENGGIVHSDTAARLRNDPAVQAAYLGGGAGGRAVAAPTRRPDAARPEAPAPAPASEPAIPSAPRPNGPTPDQIAAAALQGLTGAARDRPQTPAARQDPPAAAHSGAPGPSPAPAVPTMTPARSPHPSPVPSARGAGDRLYGLSVADLVAEAAQASRSRHGDAAAQRPRAPASPLSSAVSPSAMPSAILSPASADDSANRLKAVLDEIEQAAAQARAWRPDPRRR